MVMILSTTHWLFLVHKGWVRQLLSYLHFEENEGVVYSSLNEQTEMKAIAADVLKQISVTRDASRGNPLLFLQSILRRVHDQQLPKPVIVVDVGNLWNTSDLYDLLNLQRGVVLIRSLPSLLLLCHQ